MERIDFLNAKILITGGHATPAYAVLDELQSRGYSNFVWVGEKYNQRGNTIESPEYRTVTSHYMLPFINLKAGKLVRKWSTQTWLGGLLELWHLCTGFVQAFFIILRQKPRLVLSFGGFTAVPIVFCAKLFRKKVVTHEQTITVGLANKIIAKFADTICVSWEQSIANFPEDKVVLTGNPIRKEVFVTTEAILTSKLNSNLPTIYITGGNQGAHQINYRVFEVLTPLLESANVIHQTGNSSITNDFKKAQEYTAIAQKPDSGSYIVRDYVGPNEIGTVLHTADLLISRAGANTVTEVLALGKPTIFIPIPWTSNDEQTKNAHFVADTGLGTVLTQNKELTSKILLEQCISALDAIRKGIDFEGNQLAISKQKAQARVRLDAAEKIGDTVVDVLA